jgi:nucleoside-diphosphate-sugar epimerase
MRRVLVIGGNLFIGRELVRRLLDRGDEVTILHRGRRNPFSGRSLEIRCDRNDTSAVARAVRGRGFEYVFDNVYDWQRGTTGAQVRAAAEACGPALRRYVFVSSCAAYGDGLDRTEDSPLAGPRHPEAYCRNKADSERALLALHAEQGIATVTLRPPFIYGPHNPFYREAFFWDRLVAGRPILVPGDGSRLMQFVAVSDLVEAALLASEHPAAPGRAYNIAHSEAVRQDDLVRALGAVAGVEPDLRYVARETIYKLGGQAFQPPYYFGQYFDMPPITMAVSRAREELGFQPMAMAEGLREAWNWYRESHSRQKPDFSFDDRVIRAIE